MADLTSIVVVDDDQASADVICQCLAQPRYRVIAVGSGSDALGRIRKARPSLLVINLSLPYYNGFHLCREVKDDPETAVTKVVVITAQRLHSDIQQGMLSGADRYLTKPLRPAELRETVSELLGQRPTGKAAGRRK